MKKSNSCRGGNSEKVFRNYLENSGAIFFIEAKTSTLQQKAIGTILKTPQIAHRRCQFNCKALLQNLDLQRLPL
jgi:hypothetical protein